ncbi:MAG: fused MFS/spermidine synthase, partial [Candidatus Omnitrophota bacterium]
IVFYGNELSVGIFLANWLIWGAAGSLLAGKTAEKFRDKTYVLSLFQISLAVILPAAFFLTRCSKVFMNISPGEIIGYVPMMLSTFCILSLPCLILGFIFSLACRVYHGVDRDATRSIAHMYIAEAAGSILGGFLLSYILIRFLAPFTIIFMFSLFNAALSLILGSYARINRRKGAIIIKTAVCLLILACLAGTGEIRRMSLNCLWKSFHVVDSKDSVYGNITVTERSGQKSFFENGLHLYTVPDELSSEQAAHFALLECESPVDVLLIGGGAGGLLKEILKYPVKRVDYIELDPLMINIAEKYLDAEDSAYLKAPGVRIINSDGRYFIKHTKKKYDCVIVNLGDPYTAQLNRFYTSEFFRETADVLSDTGILSFSLTSSENYLSDELRDYLSSIYMSARQVFPDALIIPGDTVYFVFAKKKGMLSYDMNLLMSRMDKWGIEAKYVRDYYLVDKFSPERIRYAEEKIADTTWVSPNRDFKPVSYYYATVFWGSLFDMPVFRKVLLNIKPEYIWLCAFFFCLTLLLFIVSAGAKMKKRAVLTAVMTTGFAEIIFQISVILAFQVIYGYVFYKLGIIITSFMAGLALGGWMISRYMPRINDDTRIFTLTQAVICLYPLLLPLIFISLAGTRSTVISWLGSNIICPFLPVIAGIIGGIQFPLANRIYMDKSDAITESAGLTYGLDLIGACAGSLLAAALLIPILGIYEVCFLASLVNITVLGSLILSSLKKK